MMTEGDPIPDVTVTMESGARRALREWQGQALVVYFYPKDDTSGCTREAGDFTALKPAFDAAGVALLGVSKDSPESHGRFAAKHSLTVPLATDADGMVCAAFGVWGEKKMYGRTFMGIERATFLFDAAGTLRQQWRKVRVPGHADAVLDATKAL